MREKRRGRSDVPGVLERGATLVVCLVALAAIAGPLGAPYAPAAQDLGSSLAPPGSGHWLGTDSLGRDVLSRTVVGARYALLMSVVGVGLGLVPGVALGVMAASLGGPVETVVLRVMDALLALPYFLLAVFLVAALGPSLSSATLAVGLSLVPLFSRFTWAQVASVMGREFIVAARAQGGSRRWIAARHVLPAIWQPLLMQAAVALPRAALGAASLGFLGLGAQTPLPEWGADIAAARSYLAVAPHATLAPAAALTITALAVNLLVDRRIRSAPA